MRIMHGALAAALLACGGCTSIKTLPDVTRVDRGRAMEGIPYILPMRQYAIKVERTLKTCPNPEPGKDKDEAELKFDIKVTAEPKLVPGERYVVDYRALGSLVKTSDFAIENHAAGTLKTVNIAAEDQSADIVKDVVSTGLSVATTGFGIPKSALQSVPKGLWSLYGTDFTTAPSAAPTVWTIQCTAATEAALVKRKAAKDALKTETDKLAEENQRVEDLALAGVVSEAEKKALLDQLKKQRDQTKKVEKAKEAYADAVDATGAVEQLVWPRDFADGDTAGQLSRPNAKGPIILGDRQVPIAEPYIEKLAQLFEPAAVAVGAAAPDDACSSDTDKISVRGCIEPKLTLFARFDAQLGDTRCVDARANRHPPFNCHQPQGDEPKPLGQEASDAARAQYREDMARYRATIPFDARDFTPEPGVFVRPPEMGRLLICKENWDCLVGSENMALTGDWVSVPQLGQLRLLRFRNRMFENNLLVVQLGEDGSIVKFQYASKASVAEQLAAVAAKTAGDIKAVRKDAREELAAQRAEQVAALSQEITLITKAQELDKLKNPKEAEADPMKEAQLQQVQAQVQLLHAQAALANRTNN